MKGYPPGAFVISLDFELHWGNREKRPLTNDYQNVLLTTRQVIPEILSLFRNFGIAASWATVGFLFARNKEDLSHFAPKSLPNYRQTELDPYSESVGDSEDGDPFHYAPSLIERIMQTPRQELATHTYSHYYCLAEGAAPDSFESDIRSAIRIMGKHGIVPSSIIFPRNQHNPQFDGVLSACGITCYRGSEASWFYSTVKPKWQGVMQRAVRGIDYHFNILGSKTTSWDSLIDQNGLVNVPSSRFLRPFSPNRKGMEILRLKRIKDSLEIAKRERGIFHLWWHPHNFGVYPEENLQFLAKILETYRTLASGGDLLSLNMKEVAEYSREI
ncbi:polysaccharide deacetylase family protein [Verrucomicrobia bacterium]|nr:polysaccharide deacetylase family protein [Verrucomicrobiota bacterium]